jgi:hypothetical protein
LTVSVNARTVIVTWELPPSGAAPGGYHLIVTGAFNATIPLATRSITAQAAPGSYTLSVAAVNACGESPPTATQTFSVQ